MTFASIEYIFFLPLVLILYFILPVKLRWILLLSASYLFYAYWNASLLFLIVISTLIDYWAGLKMGKCEQKSNRIKYLYFSLIINLGMLFFFKYFSFCNELVRDFLETINIEYTVSKFDIFLPVGISFYTFQTLSYSIDVYRGNKKPEKHLGIFALYVSFFPQLVAGPIERSINFLPQLYEKHKFSLLRIVEGSKLIVWGLFKKMVIGDNLAILVNQVYSEPNVYSSPILTLASVAFTLQVYCDFSGYTDIAIGSAKLFGFRLSDNFNRPFFASTISKFWKRWHMSLTEWIGDYFYKPLLNRYRSKIASYIILYIVLITIGVWHGAGGQFFLFGCIHATYLSIYRLTYKSRYNAVAWFNKNKIGWLQKIFGIFLTFCLVVFSLVCFASDNIKESILVMSRMLSGAEGINSIFEVHGFYLSNVLVIVISLTLLFIIEVLNNNLLRTPFIVIKNDLVRWFIYFLVLFFLFVFSVSNNSEFYYFQF